MKLSVLERITVQGLLPQETNFTNLKLLRIAREALSFNDEELKALQFEEGSESGTIQWKDGAVPECDVELGETATLMIVDALKKLDDEKKLTNNHFSLYEKFVEPPMMANTNKPD